MLRSFLDEVSRSRIAGWAQDDAQPDAPLNLLIPVRRGSGEMSPSLIDVGLLKEHRDFVTVGGRPVVELDHDGTCR